jgi:hypothetical protein
MVRGQAKPTYRIIRNNVAKIGLISLYIALFDPKKRYIENNPLP